MFKFFLVFKTLYSIYTCVYSNTILRAHINSDFLYSKQGSRNCIWIWCFYFLVKQMSVLINFLLQNVNHTTVLSKICWSCICRTGPTNFVNSARSSFLRDRPFNLQGGYGFLLRSKLFFSTTRYLHDNKTPVQYHQVNVPVSQV